MTPTRRTLLAGAAAGVGGLYAVDALFYESRDRHPDAIPDLTVENEGGARATVTIENTDTGREVYRETFTKSTEIVHLETAAADGAAEFVLTATVESGMSESVEVGIEGDGTVADRQQIRVEVRSVVSVHVTSFLA